MSLASSTSTITGSLTSMAVVTPSLTTTFTPTATTCTQNHLTMLANREYEIWNNMPVPVPGSTFTDCYPSQFITSWLLSAGAITQPAFDPLICPQNYQAVGPYTSNYIACCPSGYSFAQPSTTPFTDRPAFGGTCYTPILEGTPVIVTAYGSSGVTATTTWAATVTNAQAYAYPIDGYAFGVAQVPSITGAATTTASGTGAVATHTVLADTDPVFTPSSVNANIGDMITFLFGGGNHSVTQSTFDNPCERMSGGFDSGYEPNINGADATTPNYTLTVSNSNSQWFFSKQSTECSSGMVFALNPSTIQPFSTFRQNALNTKSSSSGTSTGVKVGASIGSIAGFAIILAALLFFFRRRNRDTSHPGATNLEDGTEIGTSQGSWPIEPKPDLPPKGAELHDESKPGELNAISPPSELESGEPYGTPNDPAEMWSPTSTMVSRQESGLESLGSMRKGHIVSPDER